MTISESADTMSAKPLGEHCKEDHLHLELSEVPPPPPPQAMMARSVESGWNRPITPPLPPRCCRRGTTCAIV